MYETLLYETMSYLKNIYKTEDDVDFIIMPPNNKMTLNEFKKVAEEMPRVDTDNNVIRNGITIVFKDKTYATRRCNSDVKIEYWDREIRAPYGEDYVSIKGETKGWKERLAKADLYWEKRCHAGP